jgi:DNA-3-methyladenine glycosylase II
MRHAVPAASDQGKHMGIPAEQLTASVDELCRRESGFAAVLARHGYPEPRIRERGYVTLVRTIVGQQVSVKAAASMYAKLDSLIGATDPKDIAGASDERLREAGMSRQKAGYLRSLAELVLSGELDLDRLPADDEEAIAQLTRIKGIGRWSAEIYLLFAEGRPDVWPAGDLAVQIAIGQILGHAERPSEKAVRELAEAWRPHRGAAAIFAWHHYNGDATL